MGGRAFKNFQSQGGQGGGGKGFFLPRVRFQEYFCPKQDHGFKPLAAPLYPDMGQVSTPSQLGLKREPIHFCPKLCCVRLPRYCERLA